MQRRFARTLGTVVSAFLSLSCGGTADDRGLCTVVGPEPSGYQGCDNALLNLAVHPCQVEVEQECGTTSAETACANDTMASCATNYYLRNYPPQTLPDCDSSKPILPVNKQLNLTLYRYSNLSDQSVVPHTQGLQRYYASNQLTMNIAGIAAPDRTRYAVAGTEAELNKALTEAGIPPTATTLTDDQDTRAQQVIDNFILAPTVNFIARHSVPAESKVNVVIIDQIMSPELVTMMGIDGVVVGLGLSSALIARLQQQGDTTVSLNAMLQISGDFTPTLFVGHSDIARLTGNYDIVIAHETGHALGLPHVDDQGNLMQQGGSLTCRPWLGQDQIDMMGPFSNPPLSFDDGHSMHQDGSLYFRRWFSHERVDMMGPFADLLLSSRDALSHILTARRNVLRYLLARRQGAHD